MSRQLIENYLREVENIKQYGGEKAQNEGSLEVAVMNLIRGYCQSRHYILVPKLAYKADRIIPDGTIKNALRLDCGYWESKDKYDDLDTEIQKKIEAGYPTDNILFEDKETAILIQNGKEVLRVKFQDEEKLNTILNTFVNYERIEITEFNQALEQFKHDLPAILDALRDVLDEQGASNQNYQKSRDGFLELCKKAINPTITLLDIREMIIQHILTEDLFMSVFDETQFHRENSIAHELSHIVDTFFSHEVKRNTLDRIQHYYKTIKSRASQIADHHEKQHFLKVLYENFYKAYNPDKADRLGVIYTPNEIVRFMIEGTEHLLQKHFNRLLSDPNVEILDPATGTGTYITEIIDYLPTPKLEYKYKNELHCNEVEILPYYLANLNIEFTYRQKMGKYEEFPSACFVDTLDNINFDYKGKQQDFFFNLGDQNLERIKRQNSKKISVIIGNPPYNANQQNENDNNKNRDYFNDQKRKIGGVDGRIRQTYIKESTAQKTKVTDMYAKFYRWASDRLDDNGVIAFITNRSFINSRSFDGFRACIEKEFAFAYIIDTKSDVRANPKITGTTHNVFGIQTGVAVMFLVKKKNEQNQCQIQYFTLRDEQKREEKLEWFANNHIRSIPFDHVTPDTKHNWINMADNDFDELLPLTSKQTKFSKSASGENALFKVFSNGINTARDGWMIDFSSKQLVKKVTWFIQVYENEKQNTHIKWSRNLKNRYRQSLKEPYRSSRIVEYFYRPFVKKYIYKSDIFIDELGLDKQLCISPKNAAICLRHVSSSTDFMTIVSPISVDWHFLGDTAYFTLNRFDSAGHRIDNITEWGLQQFQKKYSSIQITKTDIFQYVYAILHHPLYLDKYKVNLRRDLPRIPLYDNFSQWAKWGQELMNLHINFETAKPFRLKRVDLKTDNSDKKPKPKLKADKASGEIILDENTSLTGIPAEAWEYRLGNRSALEWILDQYKEKKPKDPTIREKFNTYCFADYKEQVIDLLQRVTTVSVETLKIIREMEIINDGVAND